MLSKIDKNKIFEKAALVKRIESEIEKIKAQEIELKTQLDSLRMSKQEKTLQVDGIRQAIKETMLANNKAVLKKAGEFTLKVKKSTLGTVIIHNEKLLPERFKKITIAVDKASIRKEIKEGQFVNGAGLEFKDILYITK